MIKHNSKTRNSHKSLYDPLRDFENEELSGSYYSLEEDEEENMGLNTNVENEEEIEEDEEDDVMADEEDIDEQALGDEPEKPAKKRPNPIMLMLRMMLNPVEGWKEIRRSRISPDETARRCFYPLAALAAISCFVSLLYEETATLNDCMVDAIATFCAFFFGNFLILMLEKSTLPKALKKLTDTPYCKNFVMFGLSTLAIFDTLLNILPMISPILVFLPIWTIYLAIRGAGFFRFPAEKSNLLKTMFCFYIIGAPIALFWLFDTIL